MEVMGDLFGFAKDVGRRLFNREDEAAQRIQEHIAEENPGIEGIEVMFKDGVAKLSGKAATPEALEKAVLMAGNVKGVERVNADDLDAPPQQAEVEYYVVERGDTLSAIAKEFYGNAMEYPKIFEANREVIQDPNLIFPGQKIRIPAQ